MSERNEFDELKSLVGLLKEKHGDPRVIASFGQRLLAEALKCTAEELDDGLDVGPMDEGHAEAYKRRFGELIDAIKAADPACYGDTK